MHDAIAHPRLHPIACRNRRFYALPPSRLNRAVSGSGDHRVCSHSRPVHHGRSPLTLTLSLPELRPAHPFTCAIPRFRYVRTGHVSCGDLRARRKGGTGVAAVWAEARFGNVGVDACVLVAETLMARWRAGDRVQGRSGFAELAGKMVRPEAAVKEVW